MSSFPVPALRRGHLWQVKTHTTPARDGPTAAGRIQPGNVAPASLPSSEPTHATLAPFQPPERRPRRYPALIAAGGATIDPALSKARRPDTSSPLTGAEVRSTVASSPVGTHGRPRRPHRILAHASPILSSLPGRGGSSGHGLIRPLGTCTWTCPRYSTTPRTQSTPPTPASNWPSKWNTPGGRDRLD